MDTSRHHSCPRRQTVPKSKIWQKMEVNLCIIKYVKSLCHLAIIHIWIWYLCVFNLVLNGRINERLAITVSSRNFHNFTAGTGVAHMLWVVTIISGVSGVLKSRISTSLMTVFFLLYYLLVYCRWYLLSSVSFQWLLWTRLTEGFGWKTVWSWHVFLDPFLVLATNAAWISSFYFIPLKRTLSLEKCFYYWQLGKTASPSVSLLTCIRQQMDII